MHNATGTIDRTVPLNDLLNGWDLSLREPDWFQLVGQIAYLVRAGGAYRIQPTPPLTNLSREPRVRGWLGETNNHSATALGKVRIAGVLSERERVISGSRLRGTEHTVTLRLIELD